MKIKSVISIIFLLITTVALHTQVKASELCFLQENQFEEIELFVQEVGEQKDSDQSEEQALQEVRKWIEKFGSVSAMETAFKNKPKSSTEPFRELTKAIFQGEQPRLIGIDPETGRQIPMSIEDYYPADERDLRMIQNIKKTVEQSGPNDLVIVFAGETHVLDYFYRIARGPQEGIYYVGMPTWQGMRSLSKEMEEMLKLWKDLKNVVVVEGLDFDADDYLTKAEPNDFSATSGYEVPTRLGAALFEEDSPIEKERREGYLDHLQQMPDEFSKPKVIFLADHHEKRYFDHILQMVGSDELLALGYDRIILSFEGYNPDQQIESVQSLAQREYWTNFVIGMQGLYAQLHEEFQRILKEGDLPVDQKKILADYDRRIAKTLADIEEGRVINHPAEHALLLKLREIEKASEGRLKVSVVGNDMRVRGHPVYRYNELTPAEGSENKPPVPWGWKNQNLNAK